MAKLRTERIRLWGIVQGVGFRPFVAKVAERLGMKGEVANIGKIASASARQLEAIEKIKRGRGLDSLPDDLREIAQLRLDNPEMSLRDLGANLSVPISRSGANHRMQRLLEYADGLEDNHGRKNDL